MSFLLTKDDKVNITFSPEYSKAIFGNLHIAFVDKQHNYYIPSENKKAIINSLWFYENKVCKCTTFPFYNGESVIHLSPYDKRVLKQILGLPSEIFDQLNIDEDIIEQLNFKDNLSTLKKECYSLLYQKYDKKWYIDDFKLYLINLGFYFPYDETKPFISNIGVNYPIFFNSDNFLDEVKKIIDLTKSERYLIDYLYDNASEKLFSNLKLLDDIDFEKCVDYFINNIPNDDIDSKHLNEEFKIVFSNTLRKFVSSLVNFIYDYYSFNVLNKVSKKLSFLTIQKLNDEDVLYCLSGFNFETYSRDKKEWFLLKDDKERLINSYQIIKEKKENISNAVFFAQLGLPHVLFKYIKDKEISSVESFIELFNFINLPYSLNFQSAKRGDLYSYIIGDNKHLLITLRRELLRQGIKYSSINPFDQNNMYENNTIEINITDKNSELNELFNNKKRKLHEDLYLEFLMDNYDSSSILREKLRVLDNISNNTFLYQYYHNFNNLSVEENVLRLLKKYEMTVLFSPDLLDFFFFLFSHPYNLIFLKIKKHLYEINDSESLISVETSDNDFDTYEPNLPYPYVYFGSAYYSFRKKFISTPYIPIEDKDTIELRENFYRSIGNVIYEDDLNKSDRIARFIKKNIGLPTNVSASINFNRKIINQIKFKENISHLALHAEPTFHNNINEDKEALYNIYSSYIINEAVRYGLYSTNLIFDEHYVTYKIIEDIENNEYHGIINFDKDKILPIFANYLDTDSSSIYALLLSFFSSEFLYSNPCNELTSFGQEDKNIIYSLLFKKIEQDEYDLFHSYFFLISLLAYIYKGAELAYALKVSQNKIPELITSPFCLNIDYQPKLPLPYIHLGKIFNAYSYDEVSNEYYFCSCDKESILGLIDRIYEAIASNAPSEITTPLTLALAGFPYVVIKKYADINFLLMSPTHFVNNILKFKDGICRRCTNIPHAAYKSPFIKSFPHKEDLEAEYSFAYNLLAHNQITLIPPIPLNKIKFENNYKYELNSNSDPKIPTLLYFGVQPSEQIYTFFTLSKTILKIYLQEFVNLNTKIEVVVLASGVIMDAYSRNNEIFYDFIFNESDRISLHEKVIHQFPEIERNRKEIIESICQSILGFITFLIEKYIKLLVEEEMKVGE